MSATDELEFPALCHYRVIAEDREHMFFVIETVLLELGVTAPLEKANTSANGTYVSFGFSVEVPSREVMNRIDRELRNIEGVRMVL
jgi:putative lipoic acid-binding regulatory protein